MRVVVQADGGASIGLGHVIRCLALAERLRERGAEVTFLTRASEPRVLAKIEAGGCGVVQLPSSATDLEAIGFLLERVAALGTETVVADSYETTVESQRAIKAAGARLMVIDDLAEGHFVADVVLNQNIDARADAYSVEPYTRLLLGPRYALLRRKFSEAGVLREKPAGPPRVLVMMGGADPDNLTARVLDELDVIRADFVADLVVGAAFRELDSLAEAAGRAAHPVEVHHDPPDLPALMRRSSLAVSGAGSTCWELAFLGVPTILLVLARNQAGIAAGLQAAGFAVNLGPVTPFPLHALRDAVAALLSDRRRRASMATVGRALVDGAGADRVAAELLVP